MIGYIILGIFRRSICLGIGIDAEHREIAGLAGPHPVVGVAAKLAHRLRNGKDQTKVTEHLINRGIVTVTFIESIYLYVEGLIDEFYGIAHHLLQRVNDDIHISICYVPLPSF